MFERLSERAGRVAAERAEAKAREIGTALAAELPSSVACEASGEGVVVSGRGLRRRYVTDPELRATIARAR